VIDTQSTRFLDSRPAAVEPFRPMGGSANARRTRFQMPEDEFSAKNMFEKFILVRNVNWTTSDPVGTILTGFDVPEIIAERPSLQNVLLGMFAYMKFALIVRIQVNTTKFHQGRLMITSDPFVQYNDVVNQALPTKSVNIYSMSMQPMAQVDAAESNVVEVEIPWEHIQDYLTTNSKEVFDVMTRIRILVLNQLDVSTGGSTIANVTVYIRAKELELNVPINPHPTTIPAFQRVGTPCSQGLDSVISGVGNVVGSVTSAIGHLTSLDFMGLLRDVKGAIGGVNEVVGSFDQDKPAIITAGNVNHMHPFGVLAHMKGHDTSIRLASSPVGGYMCHDEFSGAPVTEMNIQEIVKKKGLVSQFNWTTAQPVGRVLKDIPVLPSYAQTFPALIGDRFGIYNTFLSYFSSWFVYWRGSISYRFDFVCTQFQTGRLMFVFMPNAIDMTLPIPSLERLSNNPIAVFDLKELRSVSVTIPYQSSVPRKTWAPDQLGSIFPPNYTDQHILGHLYVVIVNELSAPNNTPTSITVNMYQGAGDDFELSVPRHRPRILDANNVPAPIRVVSQAGEKCCSEEESNLQTRTVDAVPENVLVAGNSRSYQKVAPFDAFCEGNLNVKDLARRYGMVSRKAVYFSEDNTVITAGGTQHAWTAKIVQYVTPYLFTDYSGFDKDIGPGTSSASLPCAAMSRTFAAWHGAMRFKFQADVNRTDSVVALASYIMDANVYEPDGTFVGYGAETSYPSVTTNFCQNASLEIECPFYSGYNQLLVETTVARHAPDTLVSGRIELTFSLPPNTTLTKSTELFTQDGVTWPIGTPYFILNTYAAAGDDMQFSYLVAPPITYSNEQLAPLPTLVDLKRHESRQSMVVNTTSFEREDSIGSFVVEGR